MTGALFQPTSGEVALRLFRHHCGHTMNPEWGELDRRGERPERCYAFWMGRHPIYVGRTIDIVRRTKEHLRREWGTRSTTRWHAATRLEFSFPYSAADAHLLEAVAITAGRPIMNDHLNCRSAVAMRREQQVIPLLEWAGEVAGAAHPASFVASVPIDIDEPRRVLPLLAEACARQTDDR